MSEKALVTLSTKSWHYKLIKLVLGSAAPTPENMHNLCPYFWLLIFSLLACPFLLPLKAIYWIFSSIINGFTNFVSNSILIPAADSWEDKLTDLDVYQILDHEKSMKKLYKKLYSSQYYSDTEFAFRWWEKKYKKNVFEEGPNQNYGDFTTTFYKWRKEQREEYEKIMEKVAAEKFDKYDKKVEYEEKISIVRDGIDDFFTNISNMVSSWKNIIKWTKRIVGVIVTAVGLFATYFVVNFLGRGILWLIANWNWLIVGQVILTLLILAAIIGTIVGIVYLFRSFNMYMRDKGSDSTLIKFLYTLAQGFAWPFVIIFYRILWQLVILNLVYIIVKVAKLLWGSILGFLGIFGEYFGASYTDYCPGIEWNEKENK